ncbi:hypothetical protein MN032_17415 [Agromyces atrinae]|uniref:hypothetical protein n=1 Tax=Agromyces atrinae TaxID=592376 RepID=UPI001F560C49|nr:hypothetical protein [Agromyces atrinae]MCI2959466.1 hypothetical protein [Agromyces atrinae]
MSGDGLLFLAIWWALISSGLLIVRARLVPRFRAIAGGVEPRWLRVSKLIALLVIIGGYCTSAVMLVQALVHVVLERW